MEVLLRKIVCLNFSRWVALLGAALVVTAATISSSQAQSLPAWTRGGTLHKVTVSEFLAATERNQLATAADWAAITKPRPTSFGVLRVRAAQIVVCARQSTAGVDGVANMRIAEIVASCIILMGMR